MQLLKEVLPNTTGAPFVLFGFVFVKNVLPKKGVRKGRGRGRRKRREKEGKNSHSDRN